MASNVKWIKLTTDFFDDEKILLIESMPEGYIIIIVWVKLLCLAGKQNNSGVFKLANGMPYTKKMLATIFRLDEATVSLAFNTFQSFGMIHIVDGVITISNWGKHQNLDKIEASNEYMRNYMKEYRAKQKAIATGEEQRKTKGKPNPKSNIKEADKELNLEKDKDKNIDTDIDQDKNADVDNTEIDKNNIPSDSLDYNSVLNSFTAICKSLPKAVKLTDSRKMAMDAAVRALNGVSFVQLFKKVESSDFLAGRTSSDWRCTFDWIMEPKNIHKILSGKYHGKATTATVNYSDNSKYENLKMEVD